MKGGFLNSMPESLLKSNDPQCRTRWYTHKFHGPGLSYEIGFNIRTGRIVSTNGRFQCGENIQTLALALEAFVLSLNDGERAMADKGYRDEKYFILPNDRNYGKHKLMTS